MLRRVLMSVFALVAMASAGTQQAHAQLFGSGPWSGLYVGAHGGYGWVNNADPSVAGYAAGLHAGANLQLGSALVGIEGDYTWSNADGSALVGTSLVSAAIDQMWSVRGRLGFIVANSVMLYGTAGFGGMDVSANANVAGLTLTGNARYSGIVYGGGAEVLLTRNIMLRAEALRFDLDGNGAASGDNAGVTQVRAAISYKF